MATTTAMAQSDSASAWKTAIIVDLTTTQAAYSDSWVGGEAGSFNWVGNLNGSAEKQLQPRVNFKSTLKMSFGQTHTQDKDTKNWNKPVKSTDLIDWENVARFTFGGYVDPYAAFRVETQFLDASFDAKKRYLNPIKLTESGGIARVFYDKEDGQIMSRLGLAIRQMMDKQITDTVALSTQNVSTTDGGFESVTDVSYAFNERLKYTGKLTLYKALFYSEKDAVQGTPFENDWKAIDVNWENIINAQISKIVTVNLYLQLLYDKQVSVKGRLKETLGIGFVFNLM